MKCYIYYLLTILLLISSCQQSQQQTQKICSNEESLEILKQNISKVNKISKLEKLKLCYRRRLINYCDLSNDSIKDFPDLSKYRITSLNLSHNQLDTIIVDYLPKGIISLDMSHNNLKSFCLKLNLEDSISFSKRRKLYKQTTLREVDFSYNQVGWVISLFPLRKIIAPHNNIKYINFNHSNINYLDIAHNPNLSNRLDILPDVIDTIYREGIANKQPLISNFNITFQSE